MVRRRLNTISSVRIERVQRCPDRFCGDVTVWVRFGSARFEVNLDAAEFTEAALKRAIARKLVAEFGFRRAKGLKGRRYTVGELLQSYREASNPSQVS